MDTLYVQSLMSLHMALISYWLLTMEETKEAGISDGNARDVHVANWQCDVKAMEYSTWRKSL
jgi:hypothetical protein